MWILSLLLVLSSLGAYAAHPPLSDVQGVKTEDGVWAELQFHHLPILQERELMKDYGIILYDFIKDTRYWCFVKDGALQKLKRIGRRDGSVVYIFPPVNGREPQTLSPVIRRVEDVMQPSLLDGNVPEWALTKDDLWIMDMLYRQGVESAEIDRYLRAAGCRVVHHSHDFRLVTFEGTRSAAEALAEEPWVASIGFIAAPQELYSPSTHKLDDE